MGDSHVVKRTPVELTNLLDLAGDDRAVEDLRRYFEPDRAPYLGDMLGWLSTMVRPVP